MPSNKSSKPAAPAKKTAKADIGNPNTLRDDDLARVSGGVTITKTVDKPSPKLF
jgi:hypothetical protein